MTVEPIPQVVAGLFYDAGGFEMAMAELRWTVRQNAAFWRNALLFVDPDCEKRILPYTQCFAEIVVDHDMPPEVKSHRKWNCKGWWAKRAVDRFGRILYCDFDIVVVRQPDADLGSWLGRGPRFLHMPGYHSPRKVVGCGCAFYDRDCDWDRFLDLIYHKWRCDERAWTETLAMTKDKQLADRFDMNPRIVNWDWLMANPLCRQDTYLIHGLNISDGWVHFRRLGFDPKDVRFHFSWRTWARYWLRREMGMVCGLAGRRQAGAGQAGGGQP
jgi:hypothetical protein